MASKGGPPDNRTLPSKEAALFRQLVKQYETKQYKKGVKTADTVLRKFPDHGETLAMKGLVLNCLEKREEAYELVKRGVKNDIKSHVCWHVYGLLYRSDREYDEAIKCYKNALRMDKDNLMVLRDLALLQIQMRDLPGFLASRQSLLELKSGNKLNWVALAVAHHLCEHHEVAARVLEACEATMEAEGGGGSSEAYERSEVVLYKACVLEEGGMLEEALAVVQQGQKQVKDRIGAMEQQARLLLALGRLEEAEGLYRRLLALNPDNYAMHAGLRAALALGPVPSTSSICGQALAADKGQQAQQAALAAQAALSEEQRGRLGDVYAQLQQQHPRSTAARRLPLDFLEGAAFDAAAEAFVQKYLLKGIPSLFSELRPLYSQPAKAQQLTQMFTRLADSLATTGVLPAAPSSAASNGTGEEGQQQQEAAPAAAEGGGEAAAAAAGEGDSLLWCRLYQAQEADLLGDTAAALRFVDECIEHTPTLVEAHMAKARILKHAGDLEGAARTADAARCMDLADRYLNCVAVKALLRAGHAERAEKVAVLFTRDGGQADNLYDMQAMWYEVSSGQTYLQQKQYGKALKRFLRVDTHFADFVEDQFDFHGYCLRKMTLRAYVDMLRMEDRLFAHPTYLKGAAGAVQAYLDLYDAAAAGGGAGAGADLDEALLAGMTPEEQRRHRQRRRKGEQRRQKEEAEAAAKAAAEAAAAPKKGEKPPTGEAAKKKDTDPDGVQLAATADPLGQALKLVGKLRAHAGHQLQTHLLAFEVYLRKGKYLLALQAVKQALKLGGAAHPQAHSSLVRLGLAVAALPPAEPAPAAPAAATAAANGAPAAAAAAAALPAEAREVLLEQLGQLLGGGACTRDAVAAYHSTWAEQQGGASLRHAAAAAELSATLQPESARAAAEQLAAGADPATGSHADCLAVHRLLGAQLAAPEAAAAWAARCAPVFRWSAYFEGPDRLAVPDPEAQQEQQQQQQGAGEGQAARQQQQQQQQEAGSANGIVEAVSHLALA